MSPRTAKIVDLPSREASPERAVAMAGVEKFRQEVASPPVLGPLDDILVVIDDRQLDALGCLFALNPLRRAMTFEAYLAMKGFAHTTPRRRAEPSARGTQGAASNG